MATARKPSRKDSVEGDGMQYSPLMVYRQPKLRNARMVLAFSGWMDGGDTSTGTVEYLVKKLAAQELAEIDPADFYIYNFPGSMEISALFRPDTKIENGLITRYQEPTNKFFCSEEHKLVLFTGKEPNLRWKEYAECILSLASEFNVTMIYFVGSVAGLVPHTRDPRFHGSVSEDNLKLLLQNYSIEPSNYEGPASIITYLTVLAREKSIGMVTLVAEIPAYVEGRNVKCIEAATRKLASILGLQLDLDDLRAMSDEFEIAMNELVQRRPELAEQARKMEENYDKEVLDAEMEDLKTWFEKQGIRLD